MCAVIQKIETLRIKVENRIYLQKTYPKSLKQCLPSHVPYYAQKEVFLSVT